MKKVLIAVVLMLIGCLNEKTIPPVSYERTTSIRSILTPENTNPILVPIPGVSISERYVSEIRIQAPQCGYFDHFLASDINPSGASWSVSLSGRDFYWMSNRAKNLGCNPLNMIVNYTIAIPYEQAGYSLTREESVTVLEHIVD